MHSDAIPATTRTKLAKLLGLLSSDHQGERDAAALAAARLVKATGLSWAQIITPAPVKREPLFSTWRATCAELAKRPGDLRPWERKFVVDLPGFQRISTKQRYVLKEIADRVLGRSAV
jgi:hypothetical protein